MSELTRVSTGTQSQHRRHAVPEQRRQTQPSDRTRQQRSTSRRTPPREEFREESPPRVRERERERELPPINQSPVRRPQRRNQFGSNARDDDGYAPRRPRWNDDMPPWGQRVFMSINDNLAFNQPPRQAHRGRTEFMRNSYLDWPERNMRDPSPLHRVPNVRG